MSYEETKEVLDKYAAKAHTMTGDDLSLSRMWPILKAIGNPQDSLRVIHIAGTSGKTSTAYYCSALLREAGFTVGLTVSPHVDSITERVQINSRPIMEAEFANSFSEFYSKIKHVKIQPSYFELLVAFELWYFAEQKVDYAVIETGMGGLLDATNVLQREDKLCVITDIGFDHMHVLGNTISAISSQKAGIIHDYNIVCMYPQSSEVMEPILRRVTEKHATVVFQESTTINLEKDVPLFQQRNYTLAYKAVSILAKRDGFKIHDVQKLPLVPGRMDIVKLSDGNLLVMDGAHNEQKMKAFVDSFIAKYGRIKVPILLALKKGKEYTSVVDALMPITSYCVLTNFSQQENMPMKSQEPVDIEEYCAKVGMKCAVENDAEKAFKKLLSLESSLKVVTGSFYLVAEVRDLLKK